MSISNAQMIREGFIMYMLLLEVHFWPKNPILPPPVKIHTFTSF